jgi:hypothetical protein
VLSHLTRRGDAAEAWYRGALAPREVKRRDAGSPFHAADQARRIAEDGSKTSESAARDRTAAGDGHAPVSGRSTAGAHGLRCASRPRDARVDAICPRSAARALVRRLKPTLIDPIATGARSGDRYQWTTLPTARRRRCEGHRRRAGSTPRSSPETLADGLVTTAVDPATTATTPPTDLAGVMADELARNTCPSRSRCRPKPRRTERR